VTMAVDPDPLLLLATFFISYLASNAIFYTITVSRIPKDAPTDYSQVGFSKHLSFLNVLTGLAGQLDKIIIYHFLGAVPLAVYTFATAPPKQLRTAVSFIATLAIPKFANKTAKEIKQTVNKKFVTSLYILVPIVVVYIIFAPFIYQLFFPKYLEAVPFSQVYVLFLLIMGNFSNIGAVVKNDIRLTYTFAIIPSVLNIVLMLALVKPYGLMGIILALLISKYVSTAVSIMLIRRLKD
jgi:O-antigen/teichoic acid export membrane protein